MLATPAAGGLLQIFIGIAIGCLMGYYGNWVDLVGQRAVEVWQNIPFLYMVIIAVAAISDLPFKLPAWFKILVLLIIMAQANTDDEARFMLLSFSKFSVRPQQAFVFGIVFAGISVFFLIFKVCLIDVCRVTNAPRAWRTTTEGRTTARKSEPLTRESMCRESILSDFVRDRVELFIGDT